MAENTPGSLLAGPMVAMIFVFLMVLFPSNQVQMKRPVRLSLSIRENASIKKKITGMLFASFSDKREMRPVKRGLPEKRDRTKLALSRMHAHRPECSGFQTNRTRSAL